MEAALAVGVHRGTVSRWCGTYRRDGASGLEKRKRGRRAGDRLMLTAAEARRLQRWIRDKMPDQMKLPFALWTAQAVRELIHKKLGKTLGLSTMPLYLKRFTAQKPLTRATPRDPRKIAAWLRLDYASIAARAKLEGGDPLERRDRRPRPGSDRPGGCTGRPDAGPDADQAKFRYEHDHRAIAASCDSSSSMRAP
jgi:transposase